MTDQKPRRLRVSHLIVQPVLVWDDGDDLAPEAEQPAVHVPLAGIVGYVEKLRAEVAKANEPPATA